MTLRYALIFIVFPVASCFAADSVLDVASHTRSYIKGSDRDLNVPLVNHLLDPSPEFRRMLVNCVVNDLRHVQALEHRQSLVELLATALGSGDTVLSQRVPMFLKGQEAMDFTTKAKREIKEHIPKPNPGQLYIAVLGVAEMKDEIDLITEIAYGHFDAQRRKWSEQESWSAKLVLARWGNESAITEVVNRAREAVDFTKMSPRISREISYRFLEIEYINNHKGVEFLDKCLYDDRQRRYMKVMGDGAVEYGPPADMLGPADLAAVSLSRILVGFPSMRSGVAPERYVELCRDWMRAHEGRWLIRRRPDLAGDRDVYPSSKTGIRDRLNTTVTHCGFLSNRRYPFGGLYPSSRQSPILHPYGVSTNALASCSTVNLPWKFSMPL